MQHKIRIIKESSPVALEERITITLTSEEVKKYVELLKRTWPKTKLEETNKKYA